MAHIFGMLAFDNNTPPSFLPDLSIRIEPHKWTAVTHVCRHWRETALAFPSLWSTIDSDSAFAALAFLDRSFASTLQVYLRDAAYGSRFSPSLERARFMQTVAHHSDRFAELHIQPQFRYGSNILRALKYPAPQLRALSIMLNLGRDEPQELPILFDSSTPNLERLTLANFTTWPGNTFGTNLTHLCLLDQHPRSRMELPEFLDFLESCPQLQELILVDAGPKIGFPGSENNLSRLVRLDNLSLLHIGSWPTAQSVAQFLSHLAIPARTTVHIWADCMFNRNETMDLLLPSDLTHLLPFHNLKAIHCTPRPTRRDYPQLVSVQDGALVFFSYFAGATTAAMLCSVFGGLDIRAVEELTLGVECHPELRDDAWATIFRDMPRLRSLHILRRPSRPVLSALSRDEASNDVLCRSLKSVSISDDYMLSSVRLFLFSEDRAECGVPLDTLRIITKTSAHSPRLETELEEVKQFVGEVQYLKQDPFDLMYLLHGWPTATYQWILKQREQKGRRW